MNMYDLTQTNLHLPDSYGGNLGKQRLLRLRIFRILTGLLALFVLALIFTTAGWDDDPGPRIRSCVLLYLCVLASMGLLLFAKTRTEIRRLHRESFQDCHDYNYVLYRTTYKNNRAMQMTLLLSMAKYQLLMHCPDQASQALRQLSPEKLNKLQLKSYYLYRAAAEFLLQDSIWRDDLDACHLVPVEKAAMNAQELEEAFVEENSDVWEGSPLWNVLRNWDQAPQPKAPVLIIFTGILLLYTGVFGTVPNLLPDGVTYRPLFETASVSLLFLLWCALSIYWVYRLFGAMRHKTGLPAISKVLLGIVLICLEGMFLLYGTGCMLLVFLHAPTEESVTADGLIYMREDTFMDGSIYYYQQAMGPLLCRRLTEEEREKYHIDTYENKITDDRSFDADGNGSPNASETGIHAPDNDGTSEFGTNSSSSSASADSESDTALLSEFQAVYQLLADEGQLSADGIGTLSISYSAKGTPYVIFRETQSGTDTVQYRLVYDRVSENGACDLFVYYQDTMPSDGETQTSILEFYAVNPQTLDVIPGEKHAWADVPSQAYRDATGE